MSSSSTTAPSWAARWAARSRCRRATPARPGPTTQLSWASRPSCRRPAVSAWDGHSARRSRAGRRMRATRASSPTGARPTCCRHEPGAGSATATPSRAFTGWSGTDPVQPSPPGDGRSAGISHTVSGRRWGRRGIACRSVATTTPRPLVKGTRGVRTTIALKILMAVSGGVFILFVLLHMYGNLQAFAGHDAFNEYAEHLRTFGQPMLPFTGLLWVIRIGLVVSLVVHVYAAVTLWRRARIARSTPYVMKKH